MGLQNWSTTPANNANAAPNVNMATGSAPSTVHPSVRQMMADVASWYAAPEWVLQADVPTYSSATTFTVPTNRTATYSVGRRVQAIGTGYTINGTITASAYGTVTTVTVQWDSGALDNTINSVAVGILQNQMVAVLANLGNTSNMSQGVALVGGAARVVASISALRALPKTGSPQAIVTGYYDQGDGGFGVYWYNAADTSSPDNGWSIIVAGDGGRWYRLDSIERVNTTATDDPTLHLGRTTSHSGGTPGYVNSTLRIDHTVGAGVADYEWGITSVMNNSATGGQNVAIYGQGNRQTTTTGPTWAGVMEAREVVPINDPTVGLVGLEVDNESNGTDANNNRVGIDVIGRRYNPTGAATTIGFGVRVQNDSDANVTFRTAFSVNTNCSVGLDTSASIVAQAAVKIGSGQAFAWDQAAANQMAFDGAGLSYSQNGTKVLRLNQNGSIELNNLQTVITGTFGTGTTAPVLTANKPGSGTAIGTWLAVTISGASYWVPAWAN